MNILIIDTSTSIETVVARSGSAIREMIKPLDCSHSMALFSSIDSCLKGLGLEPGDIDLIGVGTGPGSFTGIRIAVSTARMLAQVLKKPLVGVMTTMIYAVSAPAEKGDNILVAFDAKKKRVFGALYRKTGEFMPEEIVAPGDYPIELLLKKIDQGAKTVAIGDGIEKYRDEVFGSSISIDYLKEFRPLGGQICRYVADSYRADPEKFYDINRIVPFYSRKSDAEIASIQKKRD